MHINSVFTWGIEARPNGLSFSHDSDPFRPYDVENMTYRIYELFVQVRISSPT